MTFAIMLLAIYPEVQKKLRSEVLRVWPTADDVHSSTYKRDFEKLVRILCPRTDSQLSR